MSASSPESVRFATEVILQWIGVGFYIVASVLFAAHVILGRPRLARWPTILATVGLFPHGAAIVIRWVAMGHGPYMLKYEVLSSNAWIAVALLAGFLVRKPSWSALALVVMPVAILAIAMGVFSDPGARELPPTLRSVWLVFHVVFAKLAAAAFLMSMASSVLVLSEPKRLKGSWTERVPPTPALDAYTVRFIGFGFLFWTITVAAGAIWANQSWGRYWGWDPIETWSLVSWLLYGSVLHARVFFRMKPRATAWASIGALTAFVCTALIFPYLIPSLHSAYFQ